MQPIQGNKLQITLFEGTLSEVALAVNRWLSGTGEMFDVVDIGFNYQGPEYDGARSITEGTHGVLFTINPLSINEVRGRRGYAPIEEAGDGTQEEAVDEDEG